MNYFYACFVEQGEQLAVPVAAVACAKLAFVDSVVAVAAYGCANLLRYGNLVEFAASSAGQ